MYKVKEPKRNISIRFSDNQLDELSKLAVENKRRTTEFIRLIVEDYLEKKKIGL